MFAANALIFLKGDRRLSIGRQWREKHSSTVEDAHSTYWVSVHWCVRLWCHRSLDQSFMVDPLSYFSIQPVLHDWCNKGHGMYYLVCGMVHINEPLLLIRKSSPCGGSGFPLSQSEWSFTICPTPYNRK